MRLVLVRHGESNWNRTGRVQGWRNPGLSPIGREQTRLLGQRLSMNRFKALYSSPLRRACECAMVLSDFVNLPIKKEEALKEMRLGDWEGKSISQVEKEYPDMLSRWYERPTSVRIPGAEDIRSFSKRVVRAFDKIKRENEGKDVLVVTHGGVISIYMVHILGMNLDYIWRIPLKNTAITTLLFYGDRVNVANFNDTCHLSSELTFQRAW
jgi:broad specificity phosphatase PhoE